MKSKTSATQNLFKEHKSYSPDEIIAAGGATAFGEKMGKNRDSLIKALENEHKSYTPDEVFAAGGTTVFGLKTQEKKLQALKAIESAPPIEPFTNEEWDDLMNQVANDK
jgi:hypothetical protein